MRQNSKRLFSQFLLFFPYETSLFFSQQILLDRLSNDFPLKEKKMIF